MRADIARSQAARVSWVEGGDMGIWTQRWLAIGCVAVAIGLTGCGDDDDPGTETMTCDIVVVGGGAGGLHTAFRLGETMGPKVCLFEKENQLGGRIKDVQLDETRPD